jgi:hypothetical protein
MKHKLYLAVLVAFISLLSLSVMPTKALADVQDLSKLLILPQTIIYLRTRQRRVS